MEHIIIDEFYSTEEVISKFKEFNFEYIESKIEEEGKRKVYTFQYDYENHNFYFSVSNPRVFLGIGTTNEQTRYEMSKVIHAIIQDMSSKDCIKLIELVHGCWYKLGGAVVPDTSKYEFINNTKNYKVVKKLIKEKLETLPLEQQEDGITTMFAYHHEAKNLVRALKVLGYVHDNTNEKKKQIEFYLLGKYKNRDLFKIAFNELGFTFHIQ